VSGKGRKFPVLPAPGVLGCFFHTGIRSNSNERVKSIIIWDLFLVSVNNRSVKVDGLSNDAPFFRFLDAWTDEWTSGRRFSFRADDWEKAVSESELEVNFDLHLEFSVFHLIGNIPHLPLASIISASPSHPQIDPC